MTCKFVDAQSFKSVIEIAKSYSSTVRLIFYRSKIVIAALGNPANPQMIATVRAQNLVTYNVLERFSIQVASSVFCAAIKQIKASSHLTLSYYTGADNLVYIVDNEEGMLRITSPPGEEVGLTDEFLASITTAPAKTMSITDLIAKCSAADNAKVGLDIKLYPSGLKFSYSGCTVSERSIGNTDGECIHSDIARGNKATIKKLDKLGKRFTVMFYNYKGRYIMLQCAIGDYGVLRLFLPHKD